MSRAARLLGVYSASLFPALASRPPRKCRGIRCTIHVPGAHWNASSCEHEHRSVAGEIWFLQQSFSQSVSTTARARDNTTVRDWFVNGLYAPRDRSLPRSPSAATPRCTERSPPGAEGLFGPEDLRDRWQRTNIAVKYCPFRFSCTQQGARGVEKHIWVEVSFLLSAACASPPAPPPPPLTLPPRRQRRTLCGRPSCQFLKCPNRNHRNRRALVVS